MNNVGTFASLSSSTRHLDRSISEHSTIGEPSLADRLDDAGRLSLGERKEIAAQVLAGLQKKNGIVCGCINITLSGKSERLPVPQAIKFLLKYASVKLEDLFISKSVRIEPYYISSNDIPDLREKSNEEIVNILLDQVFPTFSIFQQKNGLTSMKLPEKKEFIKEQNDYITTLGNIMTTLSHDFNEIPFTTDTKDKFEKFIDIYRNNIIDVAKNISESGNYTPSLKEKTNNCVTNLNEVKFSMREKIDFSSDLQIIKNNIKSLKNHMNLNKATLIYSQFKAILEQIRDNKFPKYMISAYKDVRTMELEAMTLLAKGFEKALPNDKLEIKKLIDGIANGAYDTSTRISYPESGLNKFDLNSIAYGECDALCADNKSVLKKNFYNMCRKLSSAKPDISMKWIGSTRRDSRDGVNSSPYRSASLSESLGAPMQTFDILGASDVSSTAVDIYEKCFQNDKDFRIKFLSNLLEKPSSQSDKISISADNIGNIYSKTELLKLLVENNFDEVLENFLHTDKETYDKFIEKGESAFFNNQFEKFKAFSVDLLNTTSQSLVDSIKIIRNLAKKPATVALELNENGNEPVRPVALELKDDSTPRPTSSNAEESSLAATDAVVSLGLSDNDSKLDGSKTDKAKELISKHVSGLTREQLEEKQRTQDDHFKSITEEILKTNAAKLQSRLKAIAILETIDGSYSLERMSAANTIGVPKTLTDAGALASGFQYLPTIASGDASAAETHYSQQRAQGSIRLELAEDAITPPLHANPFLQNPEESTPSPGNFGEYFSRCAYLLSEWNSVAQNQYEATAKKIQNRKSVFSTLSEDQKTFIKENILKRPELHGVLKHTLIRHHTHSIEQANLKDSYIENRQTLTNAAKEMRAMTKSGADPVDALNNLFKKYSSNSLNAYKELLERTAQSEAHYGRLTNYWYNNKLYRCVKDARQITSDINNTRKIYVSELKRIMDKRIKLLEKNSGSENERSTEIEQLNDLIKTFKQNIESLNSHQKAFSGIVCDAYDAMHEQRQRIRSLIYGWILFCIEIASQSSERQLDQMNSENKKTEAILNTYTEKLKQIANKQNVAIQLEADTAES